MDETNHESEHASRPAPWGKRDGPLLGALGVAATLFFWPVLFGGKTFYFLNTLWFYYPDAVMTARAWLSGELPLWEPLITMGYPFQADPHSAVFYPPTLILLLFPFPRAYNLFVVAHVVLAGWFMVALLRRWRLSRAASLLGGGCLMFCGFTISSAADLTTLLRGLTWLPLALLVFDRYVETGSRRALLGTALVLAVQGSGTDPQYVLFTGGWLLLAGWLRPWPGRLGGWRAMPGCCAAGVLALLLLAYQYLPLGQLVTRSDRGEGLRIQEIASYDVNPRNLYNLAIPAPFPEPGSPYFFTSFHEGALPFYLDLYWGLPFLLLALVALGWRLRPRRGPDGPGEVSCASDAPRFGRTAAIALAVSLAGILLSLGYRTPVFAWFVGVVPGLSRFRFPAKYMLLAAFGLTLAGSLGFHGLVAGVRPCLTGFRRGLWLGIGVLAAILGVIQFGGQTWPRLFLAQHGAHLAGAVDEFIGTLLAGWTSSLLGALGLAMACQLLLWLTARGKLKERTLWWLLVALLLGDLMAETFRGYPVKADQQLSGLPPTMQTVPHSRAGRPPIRVLPYLATAEFSPEFTLYDYLEIGDLMLIGLRASVHEFNSLLSYMSVRISAENNLGKAMRDQPRLLRDRLAARIGAEFVLRSETRDEEYGGGTVIDRVGPVVVRRLDRVTPRAFIAGRAVPSAPGELPTSATLLAIPDEVRYEPAPDSAPGELKPANVRRCEVTEYGRHRVAIEFELAGRGLLVLLDSWYPGWKARVDGHERPIHQVDGLFRGVEVAAGEHRLQMTYEPWPFRVGAVLSLLTLLWTLGAMAWPWGRGLLPPRSRQRRGLALPILVAIIFLLATLVLAFSTYSSSRVRATGAVLNSFSALTAAEAGLNCTLLEMRNSQGWLTHELELDAAGDFVWKEALSRPVRLAGDSEIDVANTTKGSYTGRVGHGVFGAEFAVRVGRVPIDDDPATPSVDEATRFVRIESLGKKKDPGKRLDRHTRISVIAEVSNFTEYVIYDGEKVVLGMGSPNDSHHSNVFTDGRLYGGQTVRLGNVSPNGTIQRFLNLDCLRSGGPLMFADSYQVTFQKPKTLQGRPVELGPENDSAGPSGLETASGNVLDGQHGGALSLPRLEPQFYRKQAAAGGVDVSGLPTRKEYMHDYPGELPDDVIELDFGRGGYEGGPTPPDDANALGRDYPADFNGLIYSSKPLTIWGNPDRDVTIYCEADIFVSGDLNCHPAHRKNYKPKYQMPDGSAIDGTPYYQYRTEDVEKYLDGTTGDLVAPAERERVAMALISMGRVWFDQRHPTRCLGNELKGLVKLEMLTRILGDETKAHEWVRYPDASPVPTCSPIPSTDILQPGANGASELVPALQSYFGQGGSSNAGDNLWVTTASYDVIRGSFSAALADGDLTREELDGTPSTTGVADVVIQRLAADEPQYAAFRPPAPDPDLKDLTPPQLGSFTAPQRLYNLVYDEKAATLSGHPPAGKYSDQEGTVTTMMDDELFMPQMDLVSMVFVGAKVNDDPSSSDDPKNGNRHFDYLGNARSARVHYLTTIRGLEELKAGSLQNILTPMIQRFVGSEIRMAQVANHPPQLKVGHYWPPMRRRIYDATLAVRPPPLLPQTVEIRTWEQSGATEADFQEFTGN